MATDPRSREELLAEIEILHRRLEEAEEIRRAIQANEVDAFVVTVPQGDRIFTLQGAEHPYRVLVESMNEGAATLAPDGSVMYSNHRLAELLKIPLQKLIGSMLRSYVAPADALSFVALLEKCGQARCKGEIELITGTGEALPVLLSCGQLDPSESPGWFSVVITDLSEQKRTEAIIMAEKLARSIIEQAGEAIVVCDTNGQIIRTSQQANQLCQECLLLQPFDAVLPLQMTGTDRFFSVAAPLHGTVLRDVEVVLEAKTAQPFYFLLNATPLRNAQDEILGCVITLTDITARQQTEVALRQAAIVFESTREGITITDTDTSILRVNRAFCELTGYTEDEVSGQPLRILQSVRHSRAFYTAIWTQLHHAGHWQGEIWSQRKNGAVFPALLSISVVKNETGSVTHYVGIITDLSRVKNSEAQLDFLTYHDALTRLPNRQMLLSHLQHSLETARRDGRLVALLMLDLDRFKDVNDSYGHPVGDELLQQVAARLTGRLRGVDMVTRLGGDEFAVLLENLTHSEDAGRIAMEIIAALSEPWQLANGIRVRISASAGISLFPGYGQTAEELLQHADSALYRAKSEGRGRFQYFTAALTQAARQRIELEERLRRALTDHQLCVYYQPQVDIGSGRIIGAEALLRWQDPEHGLIPPGRFIPLAEETGLIGAIGEWVLWETCRQGRIWIDAGLPSLTLAVNLSPQQFHHGDITATVMQALSATGFPAERLELELTESTLMQREQEAVKILESLRGLGLHLAIDDFGTGYSSLAYLKRFPLDVLKIDKSFIDDIPQQRDAMEIATAIIAMGHTLGFKVLAEGVEIAAQLAFLTLKGCDRYQGYLCSPPAPVDAFTALLTRAAGGWITV